MSDHARIDSPPAGAASPDAAPAGLDFIRAIVADDLREGRYAEIVTRFPPEPNGFLHIGHAKSITLNFGIARETGGRCNLRFDDTNPETEDMAYVEAAIEAVRWLGYEPAEVLFASDYFPQMYAFAEHLIRTGHAYVDSLNEEEIREYRGTVTEPGRPSPYRDRSVEENLDLFRRMRAGEFEDGAHVLRGKIDMASANMLLRDPLLYRIRHATHYRTGDAWCIYPLYDYAHPIEDAIEGITHSICTLEFEINRPLYDWVVEHIPLDATPHQYEFARLNLDYTVMSKRKLLQLVREGYVTGWDDPRMPTIFGMRRRGVTPEALRSLCDMVGVTKSASRTDLGMLEYAIRDDLNVRAPRVLCVLRPLRVVLTNVPDDVVEWREAPSFPHDVRERGGELPAPTITVAGHEATRGLPFSNRLLIERDDFMEKPPRGYHRLSPGAQVRLRHGPIVRCDDVVRSDAGDVVELRCSVQPDHAAGHVKGTIHWVSEAQSLPCEVRLYDRLFTVPDPDLAAGVEDAADFKAFLNPGSLETVTGARIEPSVRDDPPGSHYQFERLGYFFSDPLDSAGEHLVFNRTVTLRDTWAKKAEGERAGGREAGTRAAAAPGVGPTLAGRPQGTAQATKAPQPPAGSPGPRSGGAPAPAASPQEIARRDPATAALLADTVAEGADEALAANWIVNELPRELHGRAPAELPFGARELAELLRLVQESALSSTGAREVLAELAATGGSATAIMEARGLRQVSDAHALWPIVEAVIDENSSKVDEYRGGRTGLLGFFVGQVMRKTGGKANPEVVGKLLQDRLG